MDLILPTISIIGQIFTELYNLLSIEFKSSSKNTSEILKIDGEIIDGKNIVTTVSFR